MAGTNKNKRPRQDKVRFMPNSHVAELRNPNFHIWRSSWTSLDKDWSKVPLYTDSPGAQVHHIYCTVVSELQMSVRFALRASCLELQVISIWSQVHWITAKWHWTLQGQRYNIYALPVCPSLKFHFVSLYRQWSFKLQAILRPVNRMTQKWAWAMQVKWLPKHVTSVPEPPNFSPFRSTTRHFRVTGHLRH